MTPRVLATAIALALSTSAWSGTDAIKIGVLNDQSGLYSDFGGKTSVEAARMAAEEMGGKVLVKPSQGIFSSAG